MASNSAYIAPSVSITQEITPQVQPVLVRPTSIAVVGETLGFLTYTETVFLDDINPVTLKQSGIDPSTLTVVSALDPSSVAFVSGQDYILSGADAFGNRTLSRNLYTTIPTGTTICVVYVDGDSNVITTTGSFLGFDPTITTDATGATVTNGVDRLSTPLSDLSNSLNPISIHDADDITAVTLQSFGRYTLTTDYALTLTSNTCTVARVSLGGIISGQVVYVSYQTGVGFINNEPVTLLGNSAVNLVHQADGVVNGSVVVTNSPNGVSALLTTSPVTYTSGATGDYLVSTFNQTNLFVDRNLGSAQGVNTIGYATDNIAVRVSYSATPTNYYQPTRFFNQADVEATYGAALDASGNINSPAAFGTYMAFINGATDVVVQPLFHSADPTDVNSPRTSSGPATYSSDWAPSIAALRNIQDVNVVVPCFAKTTTSGTINDNTVAAIISAVMSHVNYMRLNQNQYVVGIFGEDSTIAGLAQQATLQTHVRTYLGGSATPEDGVLVSPASFAFANPQSGTTVRIGGQFVAAAIAGMLSARPVQVPLTRKPVGGITDVLDFRSESDKNLDAQAGLMVIETKNNIVRVRHAITSAVNDVNTRELSVIRAKNFMMESLVQTLDTQIIGQIIADNNAPFTVATTVQGVLEALVASGAIVDYASLTARSLAPTDPTTIEVRFVYKPAYPLNYVNVIFSIDTTTGAVDTTTQPTSNITGS